MANRANQAPSGPQGGDPVLDYTLGERDIIRDAIGVVNGFIAELRRDTAATKDLILEIRKEQTEYRAETNRRFEAIDAIQAKSVATLAASDLKFSNYSTWVVAIGATLAVLWGILWGALQAWEKIQILFHAVPGK